MKIKVKIEWKHKLTTGIVIDTFGYPEFDPFSQEGLDGLLYWYEEGNGSCDCNRSVICGLSKEHWPCGEEIEFISIKPILPIGIGRSLAAPPSHTTRRTGPYRAVRLIGQNQIQGNKFDLVLLSNPCLLASEKKSTQSSTSQTEHK